MGRPFEAPGLQDSQTRRDKGKRIGHWVRRFCHKDFIVNEASLGHSPVPGYLDEGTHHLFHVLLGVSSVRFAAP